MGQHHFTHKETKVRQIQEIILKILLSFVRGEQRSRHQNGESENIISNHKDRSRDPLLEVRDASRIIPPKDELQGNSRVRTRTYASLIPKSCNFLKQFSNKKSPPCSTLLISPGSSKGTSKCTINGCVCTGQQGSYCSCALPEAEAPAPHAPGSQHLCKESPWSRVKAMLGCPTAVPLRLLPLVPGVAHGAAQLREFQLLPLFLCRWCKLVPKFPRLPQDVRGGNAHLRACAGLLGSS